MDGSIFARVPITVANEAQSSIYFVCSLNSFIAFNIFELSTN